MLIKGCLQMQLNSGVEGYARCKVKLLMGEFSLKSDYYWAPSSIMSSSRAAVKANGLLRHICFLRELIRAPNNFLLQMFKKIFGSVLENQHAQQLLQYIFAGTILEATKVASRKIMNTAKSCGCLL